MSCVVKNALFRETAKRLDIGESLLENIVYEYINDESLGGLTGEFPSDSYILEALQKDDNIVTSKELVKMYEEFYSLPIFAETLSEAESIFKKASKYFSPTSIAIKQKYNNTYEVSVGEPVLKENTSEKALTRDEYYSLVSNSTNLEHDLLDALRKERLIHRWGAGDRFLLSLHKNDLYFNNERNAYPTKAQFVERALNLLLNRLRQLNIPTSIILFDKKSTTCYVDINKAELAKFLDSVKMGIPLRDAAAIHDLTNFLQDTFAVEFGGILTQKEIKSTTGLNANAFIRNNKVFIAKNKVTADTIAEEFMHPFVNALYNNSKEHFSQLYREASKLFPELHARINISYSKLRENTYSEDDIQQELVALALSREFRVSWEKSLQDGKKTSKLVLNEIYQASSFYSKAWKCITALFNHFAEKLIGTKTRFGVEDLKGLSLKNIADLVNASDSQFWVNHKDKTRYNLTSLDKLNVHWGSGDNVELSNFAHRPFKRDNGVFTTEFYSVEQAFLFEKTRYADSVANSSRYRRSKKAIDYEILETTNGATLRQLGREIQGLNKEAWDRDSEGILKNLMLESFKQNEEAAKDLLSTGEALFTHINKNLTEEYRLQHPDKYETLFPKLLTEVREELKTIYPQYVPTIQEQNQKDYSDNIKDIKREDNNTTTFTVLTPYGPMNYKFVGLDLFIKNTDGNWRAQDKFILLDLDVAGVKGYIKLFLSEIDKSKRTVTYTPTGKERQTYTIVGEHIYNKNGEEVFAQESVDRNKIFANLAVLEKRADVVTYKDKKYVVTDKGEITSVTTGKVMKWGDENGDRRNILALSLVYKDAISKAIDDTEPSITEQTVELLKSMGFNVFGREGIANYLRSHSLEELQQSIADQTEMALIRTKAIADGTFMKAPNGNTTNLTERQWLQVRTKNFIKWFGDWINDPASASKVIDENGEPKVMLRTDDANKTIMGRGDNGSFFATDNLMAAGSYASDDADLYRGFVNLKNPYIVRGESHGFFFKYKGEETTVQKAQPSLIQDGYDGVYFERTWDVGDYADVEPGDDYWANNVAMFNPNQFKSATDNNGMFSIENDNIQMAIDNPHLSSSENTSSKLINEFGLDILLFSTNEGKLYGFVDKAGNIYLDETIISPEHPIHEYCHLWDRFLQLKNPELWARGVELMKSVPLWNMVANNEHYGKKWEAQGIIGEELENRIASEVHARFVGKTGEKALNELALKKGKKNIVAKLRLWILDAWKDLKATLGDWSKEDLDKLTVVDFNRMTVRDFADGVNFGNKSITELVLEVKNKKSIPEGNKILTSIPYNEEQLTAIVDVTDWAMNGDPNSWYMIEGKAGTGKTTIVKEIIYQINLEYEKVHKNRSPKFIYGALSHKAVLVLDDSLGTLSEQNVIIKGHTVASMLGMGLDKDTGEFVPGKAVPKIDKADFIIVDEASMINKDAFDLLMALKKSNAKLIFLGDKGLLPPIEKLYERKNLDSRAFETENKSKLLVRVRLGEESPILPYADNFWNNSLTDSPTEEPFFIPVKDVILREGAILVADDYSSILDNILSAFRTAINTESFNHIKYVCYSNARRVQINNLIHNIILGNLENEKTGYSIGDFVIFNDNYADLRKTKLNEHTDVFEPLFYNSESAVVVAMSDLTETDENGVTTFKLTLRSENGTVDTVKAVTRESLPTYKSVLTRISEAAKAAKEAGNRYQSAILWNKFWEYKTTIADIDFGYAITSHKSLGSTYDISIVDLNDIQNMSTLTPKLKSQSSYVGITRAKKVAVIINRNVEETTSSDIEEVSNNVISNAVNIAGDGATTQEIVQAVKETQNAIVQLLGNDEIATNEVEDAISVAATGLTFEEALKNLETFFSDAELALIKEALNGKNLKVMSVSRYTDPAMYSQKVVNFLKENAKKPLTDPTRVIAIELWSKHDGLPIRDILDACKQYRVAPMVSFSITGLGNTALEKGVMKYLDLLGKIKELIDDGVLNAASTTVRIDPILVGVTNTRDIQNIISTAKDMGIKKFVTSLVQSYGYLDGTNSDRKIISGINTALATEGKTYDWEKYYGIATEEDLQESNRFAAKYRRLHPELANMSFKESWKTIVAAGVKEGVRVITRSSVGKIHFLPKLEYINAIGDLLKAINQDREIEIETCSFHINGLKPSACLDPLIIELIVGIDVTRENGTYDRDTSRPECMCYSGHGDMFAWDTKCNSSCAYCYAAHSEDNPINYYNEDGTLRDFDFTRTRRTESLDVEETPAVTASRVELPTDLSLYTLHSGGALLSDSYWGEIGQLFGIDYNTNLRHYYHGSKTPKGNIVLSEEDFLEGLLKVKKAAEDMHRIWSDKYADLLARNWNQVKYADAVFAIGSIKRPGDKNKKGYDVHALLVDGGTGYAVQMAINEGKPVYVFDLETNKWYKYINGDFRETSTPKLTKDFAGIGTSSSLTEAGKKAIKDVYENTLLSLKEASMPAIDVIKNKLKEQYKEDPGSAKLTELVFNSLKDSNIKFRADYNLETSGIFIASENIILYNPDIIQNNTLLHESIHATTSYYMKYANRKALSPEIQAAIIEIEECYNLLKEDYIKLHFSNATESGINMLWSTTLASENLQALESPTELIAEITKPNVLSLIKDFDTRHKGQNIFSRLVDAVLKMLGVKKEYKSLEKTLKDAMVKLITTPNEEIRKQYALENKTIKENTTKLLAIDNVISWENRASMNDLLLNVPESMQYNWILSEEDVKNSILVNRGIRLPLTKATKNSIIRCYNEGLATYVIVTDKVGLNRDNATVTIPVQVLDMKFLSTHTFDIKTGENGVAYLDNIQPLAHTVSQLNIDVSNTKPFLMVYAYGNNKRSNVVASTTIDAIRNGERTATTRYAKHGNISKWLDLKVGDIVEFVGNEGSGSVYARITKPLTKLTLDTNPEEWSRKEGWSTDYFDKEVKPEIEKGEAYLIEFEYIKEGKPTTNTSNIRQNIKDPEKKQRALLERCEDAFNLPESDKVLVRDNFWKELLYGTTYVSRELYLADAPEKGHFVIVKDFELDKYSIHFKPVDKNNPNAFTAEEKDILFLAAAEVIPNGKYLSTRGEVSKGGVAGLNRFKLLGFVQVGTRNVTSKTDGSIIEIPVLEKTENSSILTRNKDFFNKLKNFMESSDALYDSGAFTETELTELCSDIAYWINGRLTEYHENPEILFTVFPDKRTMKNEEWTEEDKKSDIQKIRNMTHAQIAAFLGKPNITKLLNVEFFNFSLNPNLMSHVNQVVVAKQHIDALLYRAKDELTMLAKFTIENTNNGEELIVAKEISDTDLLNKTDDIDVVKETLGDTLEYWLMVIKTIDVINDMKDQVRDLFTQCYELEDSGEVNEDGSTRYKPVVSTWGVNKRIPFKQAVYSILSWTLGSKNLSEMISKLLNKKESNPWISLVIEKLTDTQLSTLQSQFFTDFCKASQLYSVVVYDGNIFKTLVVNENPALKNITGSILTLYNLDQHEMFTHSGVNESVFELFSNDVDFLDNLSNNDVESIDKTAVAEAIARCSLRLGYSPQINDVVNLLSELKTFKSLIDRLVSIRDCILNELDNENYNPFLYDKLNNPNGIRGHLLRFLKPLVANIEDVTVSTVYNDGKLYLSRVLHSYLSQLVDAFRSDDRTFNDFLEKTYGSCKYGELSWFRKDGNWRTPWLIIMADMSLDARLEMFKHKVLLNFNKHGYMKEMTPLEYELSLITEFMAFPPSEGRTSFAWYSLPMISNKPSSEFIKFLRFTSIDYKEQILSYLSNVFAQELSRIQTCMFREASGIQKGSEGYLVNFDKNGKQFNFFPFLNKLLDPNNRSDAAVALLEILQGKNITEDSVYNLYTTYIESEIRNELDTRFRNTVTRMKSNGLWEKLSLIENIGYTLLEITENMENYLWNTFFAKINIEELTIVDPAFYKDSDDLQKRLALIHAPSIKPNVEAFWIKDGVQQKVSDGVYRTLLLKDLSGEEVISNVIENLEIVFERKIAAAKTESMKKSWTAMRDRVINAFKTEINVADALGYNCPSSYRKKAIMYGKWSDEFENVYNSLKAGSYDFSTIKAAFLPLKPFVYGVRTEPSRVQEAPIEALSIPTQFKNSEYLLIIADALLRSENTGRPNLLKAIYDVMEESYEADPTKGIDTVLFESTTKSGLEDTVDINNAKDYNSAKEILSKAIWGDGPHTADNYRNNYISALDYMSFGILQNIPAHFAEHEQAHGSLGRYVVISSLESFNADGTEATITFNDKGKTKTLTVKEFKREYEQTISDNIESDIVDLSKEFGINDYYLNSLDRSVALAKAIQREVESSSRYGEELLWACTVNENGEFRIPLGDAILSKRVELLLNSIIKSLINKQKLPGGPVVLVSNFGTSKLLHIVFKDKNSKTGKPLSKTLDDFNTVEEYKNYLRDKLGGIAYYECYAPIYSKELFALFMDKDGNVDILKVEAVNPDLLKMVGLRIPTEDKYSMAPLKIVGFLPREAGDGIMLPYEITVITGSDFDVDKFYLMHKNISVKDEAEALADPNTKTRIFNVLKNRFEIKLKSPLSEGLVTLFNTRIDKFLQNPESFRHSDKSLNRLIYEIFLKSRSYEPRNGKQYRDNKIVEMNWAVLTNTNEVEKILTPQGFEEEKRVAYVISAIKRQLSELPENVRDSYDYEASWNTFMNMDIDKLKGMSKESRNLCFDEDNVKYYTLNKAASTLLGMFAVLKIAHAILEGDGLYVSLDELKIPAFTLFGTRYDSEPICFTNEYNKYGLRIGKVFGNLVGAAADAVKDPILNLIQANSMTVPILATMLKIGMSFDEAALLLSQSVITEVLEEHSKKSLSNYTTLEEVINEKIKLLENERESEYLSEEIFDAEAFFLEDFNMKIEPDGKGNLRALEGLSPNASNKIKYQALVIFLRLSKIASAIKGPTFATRFNSISNAVGPLAIDNLIMEHKLREPYNGIVNINGQSINGPLVIFDKHPILKSFAKTVDIAQDLLRDITTNSEGFRNLISSVDSYDNVELQVAASVILNTIYEDRNLLNKLSDFYSSYQLILSGAIQPFVNKPGESIEQAWKNFYNYYIKEFPAEFMKIINDDTTGAYNNNALIDAITPLTDRKTGRAILALNINGLSEPEKNIYKAAWSDLHKINPELSEKLFIYNFVRAGNVFSPKTFISLCPARLREKLFIDPETHKSKYISAYLSVPDINKHGQSTKIILDQFIRNNWGNSKLVKEVPGTVKITDGKAYIGISRNINQLYIKVNTESGLKLLRLVKTVEDKYNVYEEVQPLGNNNEFLEISDYDMLESIIVPKTATSEDSTNEASLESADYGEGVTEYTTSNLETREQRLYDDQLIANFVSLLTNLEIDISGKKQDSIIADNFADTFSKLGIEFDRDKFMEGINKYC